MGILGFASRFDPDYHAILDRGAALGYTLPGSAQQAKQNAFVLALKAASLWTPLDVLYVFATDGGSDFATLNWKAPTLFQATKVNSPTFTTNQGFNGNGSTSYVLAGWAPSNGPNYKLNDASFGGASLSSVSGETFGSQTPSQAVLAIVNGLQNGTIINNSTTFNGGGGGAGFYHSQRRSSTDARYFRNGSQVATNAIASVGVPTSLFGIGCRYSGSASQFSTAAVSMFFAGANLSGLESSFYTAWNNYFTSL